MHTAALQMQTVARAGWAATSSHQLGKRTGLVRATSLLQSRCNHGISDDADTTVSTAVATWCTNGSACCFVHLSVTPITSAACCHQLNMPPTWSCCCSAAYASATDQQCCRDTSIIMQEKASKMQWVGCLPRKGSLSIHAQFRKRGQPRSRCKEGFQWHPFLRSRRCQPSDCSPTHLTTRHTHRTDTNKQQARSRHRRKDDLKSFVVVGTSR